MLSVQSWLHGGSEICGGGLMEELKAEIFQAHVGIQAAPFFQALAACQLPLES
ncbi:hypothetical protein CCP3SC15_970001 [Gammaproteobacteria bacterium]